MSMGGEAASGKSYGVCARVRLIRFVFLITK